VRLPKVLYDALEAVAEREHYTREAPELARTVRNALEHYLACPHRRQTENAPWLGMLHNGPTEKTTVALGETRGQTENVPAPAPTREAPRSEKRQTTNAPEAREDTQQAASPSYDTTKFYLGKLCPQQHEYEGTGKSLLRRHNSRCRECDRLSKQAGRAAKRQATA
jgi:hypothetical protein